MYDEVKDIIQTEYNTAHQSAGLQLQCLIQKMSRAVV